MVGEVTCTDTELSRILHYIRKGWPKEILDALVPFGRRRHELTVEGGSILWGTRVIIPCKLRPQILKELHKGHPGIVRMKVLARSHVWWPNIDKDVEGCAKACQACHSNKNAPPKAPLCPWRWPWNRIHLDFAGPVGGKMLLIVTDAHSKWPEVQVMTTTTASKTIEVLREMFARYGIPEYLVSDNGPQFVSAAFVLVME